MSEINANIVVESNNLNITPNNNQLNITPEAIQLNIMTGGGSGTGTSNIGQLLYNNVNIIGGVANTSYANGNLSLGNVANVKISGGTNGYVLQTDGAGNLNWTIQTGGGGNGAPGGANTQIQYNDNGLFGGTAGFTFNKVSGDTAMPGNLTIGGTLLGNVSFAFDANYANFAGDVVNSAQPNITSLGNLTSLNVAGMTTIQEAKERVTINSSPANASVTFDVLTQAILYKSANATSNFTLNIRGNSTTTLNSIMNNNESLTLTFINSSGATGYYANLIQIDGVAVNPLYPLTTNPNVGTQNGKDIYTFNILKLASNTYTVFGSRIGFN
jgi:hypothetical protein